jgi:hypothetical protein
MMSVSRYISIALQLSLICLGPAVAKAEQPATETGKNAANQR